jgi:hypothetical protein
LVYVLFIIIFVYFKWLIKLGLCFSFNSLQLFYLTYLIFIVLIAICFFFLSFSWFILFFNFGWLRILLRDFFYLPSME